MKDESKRSCVCLYTRKFIHLSSESLPESSSQSTEQCNHWQQMQQRQPPPSPPLSAMCNTAHSWIIYLADIKNISHANWVQTAHSATRI